MRVLVFCPTYELFGRTLQSVFCLAWDGPIHFLFSRENPYDDPRENIQHNYILGREWFLAHGYDAMLTVESDMVVPADALERLVAVGAPVAYGLYCWRRGGHEWTAHVDTETDGYPAGPVSQRPTLAREWWGTVQRVRGWGFGCTLIRRDVLEVVEFSMEDERLPDAVLAMYCNRHGIEQKCDLGVVCGHVRRDPPVIVWPDAGTEQLYRMEAL